MSKPKLQIVPKAKKQARPTICGLINTKGGTGKSTTATVVASILTHLGYRVLLVDTDSQATATTLFFGQTTPKGLYHALEMPEEFPLAQCIHPAPTTIGYPLTAAQQAARAHLYILPAEQRLAGVGHKLNARSDPQKWQTLSQLLQPIAPHFHFIILDCPPSEDNPFFYLALHTADYIIAPLRLSKPDYDALLHLLQVLSQHKLAHLAGLLPTQYDGRQKVDQSYLELLQQHYRHLVLQPIPKNVDIQTAQAHRVTVNEYNSRAAGALAYARLTHHLVRGVRKNDHQVSNRD